MRRIAPWLALIVLLAGGVLVAKWLVGSRDTGTGVSRSVGPAVPTDDGNEMHLQTAEPARVGQRTGAAVDVTPASVADMEAGSTGIPVDVRVLDVAGEPIPGAMVRLKDLADVPECLTDGDGHCRLFAPARFKRGVLVAAEAQGYYPRMEYATIGYPLELRLHPEARLAGRVIERESRAPVASAEVRVAWGFDDGESRAVRTDARGGFEGLAIPAGSPFQLSARASGFLEQGWQGASLVIQADEHAPRTELLLERSLVREFQVVDSGDGSAVAGATISARFVAYVADAEGRFTIDRSLDPTHVTHRLFVEAPGYCRTNFEVRDLGDPSAPYLLRLPRACRIVGSLRDAEGEPMADVSVVVRLPRAIADELRRSGRFPPSPDAVTWQEGSTWASSGSFNVDLAPTDEGRFEFVEMVPGLAQVDLTVQCEGDVLATRSVGPLGPPGSVLQVDWKLDPKPQGSVRGRLLLNGEPSPGFVHWTQDDRSGRVEVAEEGQYEVDGLSLSSVELSGRVSSPVARWGRNASVTLNVQAVAGGAEQDLRVEVAVDHIRGSVVDSSGEPLGDREISVWHESDRSNFSTKSAADGTWSLEVADVPDTYRLRCSFPVREEDNELYAGMEGVVLHELGMGRLRFRALDDTTGESLSSVFVTRRLQNGESRYIAFPSRDAPDTCGWTEVDLQEGEHLLGAFTQDRDFKGTPQRTPIAAGETKTIEFRLSPTLPLTLRLASESSTLSDAHRVLLLAQEEWDLVSAETVEGRPRVSLAAVEFDPGRMRDVVLRPGNTTVMHGLALGRYRFKVFPDDVAIEPEWIDVPAEGVVEVRWVSKP